MKIDFNKQPDGVVPAIIQDAKTQRVLLHGYMNRKALKRTRKRGVVHFYSLKRDKIWIKGERTGDVFYAEEIFYDCVGKAVLVRANPAGRICKKSLKTCFGEKNSPENYLLELESFIKARKEKPTKTSLTSRILNRGSNQIAKKMGEEAVELAIQATDPNDGLFKAEASDLLYYFMVLLAERGISFDDVLEVLKKRRK